MFQFGTRKLQRQMTTTALRDCHHPKQQLYFWLDSSDSGFCVDLVLWRNFFVTKECLACLIICAKNGQAERNKALS